jgi:hypothetical protein
VNIGTESEDSPFTLDLAKYSTSCSRPDCINIQESSLLSLRDAARLLKNRHWVSYGFFNHGMYIERASNRSKNSVTLFILISVLAGREHKTGCTGYSFETLDGYQQTLLSMHWFILA